MGNQSIIDFFTTLGVTIKTRGEGVSNGNFVIPCPFCDDTHSDPHLSVHESNGCWHCWKCKKSGRSYSSLTYMYKNSNTDTVEKVEKVERKEEAIKKVDRLSTINVKYCNDPPFIKYIESRGMLLEDFDYLPYTIFVTKRDNSRFGGRVIFYTYGPDNTVFHIYGRDYTGTNPMKHRSQVVDFIPLYRFWDIKTDVVLIFESCFDAVKFESIARCIGYTNISCSAFFTSTINIDQVNQLKSLSQRSRVYFIPDNDKKLLIKLQTLAALIQKGIFADTLKFLNVDNPYKDIGDQPRDVSFDYVKEVITCL